MDKRPPRALASLVGLLLFIVALVVLHHELKVYHLHDILTQAAQIPFQKRAQAFFFTILSYLIMSGYDTLALRYAGKPLSYGKTAFASFISYAFSNNIGLSLLAGGSVRFRLYTAWGLTVSEVTKVILFCTATLWLGFLTLAGMVFLVEPVLIPRALHLPFRSVHPLGIFFLSLVGAGFIASLIRKEPFSLRGWTVSLPPPPFYVSQIGIAVLDWAVAASVLYVLLPDVPQLSFPAFLSIFLLGQLTGIVSQVPGGLGVFETVMLLLLSPFLPASTVVGSLLVYRTLYYFLPLLIAALLLSGQEMVLRREKIQQLTETFQQWVFGIVPQVLAFTTFTAGVILLFSGATPAASNRLIWLKDLLPLPVIELSHFLGSIVGTSLLILAWGMQRRLDAAYLFTVMLLAGGVVFSLLKGFDYEEAIILSAMLFCVLPCRQHFYRKASLLHDQFTPGWTAAVIIAFICSAWLVMFSYKHVEYSNDLWWTFGFYQDAPRSLRGSVGSVGVILIFALAKLLAIVPPKHLTPGPADLDRALPIVQQSPKIYAHLALLGDKLFLFSDQGNAFIMYGIERRSWIALGNPVGPLEAWPDLVWEFRSLCDRYDEWPVFYEAGPDNLYIYFDLGLTLLKFGEEGRVALPDFSLAGGSRKELRHTINRLDKEGCTFDIVPRSTVPELLPQFKTISDAWLAEKHTREKGFSLGFFSENYLKRYPIAVVRHHTTPVAFANVLQGTGKEELSLDLMRYLPESPHGVMDYLFVHLMLRGREEGYRWFNLGMAPLSGLNTHELAPLWSRAGAFLFKHGEHFYNFQGLRRYKDKFDPVWEPKYLASPGGLALPRILSNVASLVSGGIKGVIAK